MRAKTLKFFVLAAVLASTSLRGDEAGPAAQSPGPSPAEQAQEIQSTVEKVGIAPHPCAECSTLPPTLEACARALCPAEPGYPNYRVMSKALGDGLHIDGDIADKINSWLAVKSSNDRKQYEALSRLLIGKKLSVKDEYKQLHGILFLWRYYDQAQIKPLASYNDWDKLEIDRAKTLPLLEGIPKKDQEWLLRALQGLWRMPEMKDYDALSSGRVAAATYQDRYPGLPLKDAVQKDIAELESLHEAVLRKLPTSMINAFEDAYPKYLLNALKDGKRMDEDSLDSFLRQGLFYKAMAQMIANPESYAWLQGRDFSSLSKLLQSPKVLERVKQVRQILDNEKQRTNFIASVAQNCLETYAMDAKAYPTQAEVRQGREIFKQAAAAVQSRVFPKFSAHTAQMLNERFKAVQAYFPETTDEFQGDFVQGLDEELALEGKDRAQRADSAHADDENQSDLMAAYSFLGKTFKASEYLKNDYGYCDGYSVPDISDQADWTAPVFMASWISLRNPKLGKAVMAHELGHLADAAIRSGAASAESLGIYQKTESCLMEMHPEVTGSEKREYQAAIDPAQISEPLSFTIEAKMYNDEDFADLVSAMAVPETNNGCGVLDLDDKDAMTVLNSYIDDPHSSDFFRALHVRQVQAGALPQICQDALKEKGMSRNFSACL